MALTPEQKAKLLAKSQAAKEKAAESSALEPAKPASEEKPVHHNTLAGWLVVLVMVVIIVLVAYFFVVKPVIDVSNGEEVVENEYQDAEPEVTEEPFDAFTSSRGNTITGSVGASTTVTVPDVETSDSGMEQLPDEAVVTPVEEPVPTEDSGIRAVTNLETEDENTKLIFIPGAFVPMSNIELQNYIESSKADDGWHDPNTDDIVLSMSMERYEANKQAFLTSMKQALAYYENLSADLHIASIFPQSADVDPNEDYLQVNIYMNDLDGITTYNAEHGENISIESIAKELLGIMVQLAAYEDAYDYENGDPIAPQVSFLDNGNNSIIDIFLPQNGEVISTSELDIN